MLSLLVYIIFTLSLRYIYTFFFQALKNRSPNCSERLEPFDNVERFRTANMRRPGPPHLQSSSRIR